ncbi:MAG: YgeY family selenium metabolism-linked hydrolase [bacterium]|nr:YgeY family selenium metabolism-linked hydrolase [bacterium]
MINMQNKMNDTYYEESLNFLRDIIAIPSFSGEEGPVLERIRIEMERLGFDEVFIDPLGNLLGRFGSGRRIIAFDGHVDTVGIGNEDLWTVDPFKGAFRDGKIYGRGSCDQKGGLVSAIYAARTAKDIGIPEDYSILVAATVLEEEFEGLNWKYIIEENKIVPETVILTEPSGLKIRIGHKGRIDMKIRIEGISCHGSTPDLGENAIYKMIPLVSEIEQLHRELPEIKLFGKGSIAVTDIRSTSPAINAIADSSEIMLDRRLIPGDTLESAMKELQELPSFKKAGAKIILPEFEVGSYTGLKYKANPFNASWMMEENHPIVQKALDSYQEIFGEKTEPGVWSFSTNGVGTKGLFDIPTIGFGPGDDKLAHTPDEYIPAEEIKKAAEFYTALIYNLIG